MAGTDGHSREYRCGKNMRELREDVEVNRVVRATWPDVRHKCVIDAAVR